jgi:hypothetical protein
MVEPASDGGDHSQQGVSGYCGDQLVAGARLFAKASAASMISIVGFAAQ